MPIQPLHRTLEQELNALLRGVSLECLVCGEFVRHAAGSIECPECGTSLRRSVEEGTIARPLLESPGSA
jgi:Zn finger protein HypA/HybF involved in hydrogenase expression